MSDSRTPEPPGDPKSGASADEPGIGLPAERRHGHLAHARGAIGEADTLFVELSSKTLTAYLSTTNAHIMWAIRAENVGFSRFSAPAYSASRESITPALLSPLVDQLRGAHVLTVHTLHAVLRDAETWGTAALQAIFRGSASHAFMPQAVPTHLILWLALLGVHAPSSYIWTLPYHPELVSSLAVLADKYPCAVPADLPWDSNDNNRL